MKISSNSHISRKEPFRPPPPSYVLVQQPLSERVYLISKISKASFLMPIDTSWLSVYLFSKDKYICRGISSSDSKTHLMEMQLLVSQIKAGS